MIAKGSQECKKSIRVSAAWKEGVTTKLPANLEVQARVHKAWSRKGGVSSVSDLLRALLVYACCQYSLRELGMWAVLKGVGSLSQRAWRKRLEQSGDWIAWLLTELLGIHQRPVWLPAGVGRVRMVEATRWKRPAGTGVKSQLFRTPCDNYFCRFLRINLGSCLLKLSLGVGLGRTIAFDLHHVQNDRVMDNAIDRCHGGHRIFEDVVPLTKD